MPAEDACQRDSVHTKLECRISHSHFTQVFTQNFARVRRVVHGERTFHFAGRTSSLHQR